jgi:hypothetical protein
MNTGAPSLFHNVLSFNLQTTLGLNIEQEAQTFKY